MEIVVTKEEVVSMTDTQLVETLNTIEELIDQLDYSIDHDCVMDGSYLHGQYLHELTQYRNMVVWLMKEITKRELM